MSEHSKFMPGIHNFTVTSVPSGLSFFIVQVVSILELYVAKNMAKSSPPSSLHRWCSYVCYKMRSYLLHLLICCSCHIVCRFVLASVYAEIHPSVIWTVKTSCGQIAISVDGKT